jgi:hypothetical protein
MCPDSHAWLVGFKINKYRKMKDPILKLKTMSKNTSGSLETMQFRE